MCETSIHISIPAHARVSYKPSQHLHIAQEHKYALGCCKYSTAHTLGQGLLRLCNMRGKLMLMQCLVRMARPMP